MYSLRSRTQKSPGDAEIQAHDLSLKDWLRGSATYYAEHRSMLLLLIGKVKDMREARHDAHIIKAKK